MLGLKIEGTFHWGFWVRIPHTSKQQSVLPIPPPTTLLGALAFPLVRGGFIKNDGNKLGEYILCASCKEVDFKSTAALLEDAVFGCSAYLSDKGMLWEDLSRYITLQFQTKTQHKEEEIAAGGRRYLDKYRMGAINAGKIFYPNGKMTFFYLINPDIFAQLLAPPWDRTLEDACWNICRIGSKESIFSVKKVSMMDCSEHSNETIKTKLYFPSSAGMPHLGEAVYRLNFWEGGWGRANQPKFIEYIIPGTRSPVSSSSVSVSPKGKAFTFGPEEVFLLGP